MIDADEYEIDSGNDVDNKMTKDIQTEDNENEIKETAKAEDDELEELMKIQKILSVLKMMKKPEMNQNIAKI